MKILKDILYTKEHEWVRMEGDLATVGITDFAQGELGDVVFLEIETEGKKLKRGEVFGTIEAVKAVSDMFLPLSGLVKGVNKKAQDNPELVNADPYGEGWIIQVKMSVPKELDHLLTPEAYRELTGT